MQSPKQLVTLCAALSFATFAPCGAQQQGAYTQPYPQGYPPQQQQYVPQQAYPQQQPQTAVQQAPMQQAPQAFGQPAAQADSQWGNGQTPIIVPPVSFVDINTGKFGKLEINLTDGVFMDGAVDNLNLVAQNLDLSTGTLASLGIDIKGGHFQDFTIDRLTLSTQGALNFDTGILLNHRMLQFNSPALAKVQAVISQKSINAFLNSPRTLDRLSVTAQKKGAALIAGFLGPNANFGLTLSQASAQLLPNNRMTLIAQANLGLGQMAVPVPLEMNTQLALANGWIQMTDTHLATAGQEISPELSQAVVRKVNGLSQWGQKSNDIHFTFTDLKVLPNDRFVLTGTAEIYRLRFGRSS